MAIEQRPVTLLAWFEVPFISGHVAGIRHIRAPNARSAEYDLEQHPADYGLPSASTIVGRARPLPYRQLDDPPY